MEILITIMYNIVQVYAYIVFIYILLTWTPLVNSKLGEAIGSVVNPYLNIFRGKLIVGMMDLGTLVGILILQGVAYYLGTLV